MEEDEDWVESVSRAQVGGTVHEAKPSNAPSWLKHTKRDELSAIGEDDTAAQV